MDNYIIILITCGSKKEAAKITDLLLSRKLAACANIISDIESKFWWKGRIDKAKETIVFLKTKWKNFKKIERSVKRIHSYEVPEIIALPVKAGSKEYLKWVDGSIRGTGASR